MQRQQEWLPGHHIEPQRILH